MKENNNSASISCSVIRIWWCDRRKRILGCRWITFSRARSVWCHSSRPPTEWVPTL